MKTPTMLAWAASVGAYNAGGDAEITHTVTSAEGGQLSITDDKHAEFDKQYAVEATFEGSGATLLQLPSGPVFHMFFEINHVSTDGLSSDGMLKICRVLLDVLHVFYKDHTSSSAIFESVAFPSFDGKVQIDGTSWTKRGFCIVFRNLLVTKAEALEIRHAAVAELDAQVGALDCGSHQWSAAVARACYFRGIQMYARWHSSLCSACPALKAIDPRAKEELKHAQKQYVDYRKKLRPMQTEFDYSSLRNVDSSEFNSSTFNEFHQRLTNLVVRPVCTACMGKGTKTHKIKPHLEITSLDGDGGLHDTATERLRSSDEETVVQTTVRARAGEHHTLGFCKPEKLPSCAAYDTVDRLLQGGKLKATKGIATSLLAEAANGDVYVDDFNGLVQWKTDNEVTDKYTVGCIQKFIRQTGLAYADVHIKAVYATVSERKYKKNEVEQIVDRISKANRAMILDKKKREVKKLRIRVQGKGSTFCANGGSHKQSSVFFEMGPDGYWQRCFCSDDTIGSEGKTCVEYSKMDSGGRPLSSELSELFGTAIVYGNGDPAPVVLKRKAPTVDIHGRPLSKKRKERVAMWHELAFP
ncbi:unnamed protein product [Ectocarpus sp. 6 AP-2014]